MKKEDEREERKRPSFHLIAAAAAVLWCFIFFAFSLGSK